MTNIQVNVGRIFGKLFMIYICGGLIDFDLNSEYFTQLKKNLIFDGMIIVNMLIDVDVCLFH